MQLMRLAAILSTALVLGACGDMGRKNSGPTPAPVTPAQVTSSAPTFEATQVSSGDAAAAAAADASGGARKGELGSTIASLGNASEGGMWLKTPLVRTQSKGRVVDAETGRSANVTLIPLGGVASGGSQISLKAMQALGLGLTDLPDLRVFGV